MSIETRPRLFDSDLKQVSYSISFNGKDHMTHLQITGSGDPLVKAIDCVSMVTKHDYGPAGDHFRKIVKRNKNWNIMKSNFKITLRSGI